VSDEGAFLQAICADPADDTARLVFGDFLQEQGGSVQTAWALFIRAHVRLVAGTETGGDVPNVRRFGTEYWLARFAERLGVAPGSEIKLEGWERGFPNHLSADYPVLQREWTALLDRIPFRHVRIGGMEDEAVEDLVWWPRLECLVSLDLTTWDGTLVPRTLSERGVAALVKCPALAGLESLALSFLDVTDRVAELILDSPHLARLRALALRTSTAHESPSNRVRKRLGARFGPNAAF
jgi:uncharacterized protein (TIGR02996 family)